MKIKTKIFFWFLLPSILFATTTALFCYFYTRKTVEQNIFDQLEIAADELREHVHIFIEEKKGRTVDFSSDGFIRDCTEEITMKEDKKAYYASALNTHLITNKKSLGPGILEVFVIDFKGKIISSTDESRIGEDVSGKEYFSETASSDVYNSELYYDTNLKEIVIDFYTVLLSKIKREPVGIIVNRIRYEQKEDKGLKNALIPKGDEQNYSQLIAVNRARILDFGSDGFIRDSTEEITKREDRVKYYRERLNRHLAVNKLPLNGGILEVFVVDFSGKVISSTKDSLVDSDVSGEVYFSKTTKYGSSIGDIHYSPEFGQNTIESANLLLSKEGQEPIGIFVNRYRGDSLSEITKSGIIDELGKVKQFEGLGETGELYLVNKDKLMISGSRFKKDVVLKQIVDTEGVRTAFDNGVGMVGVYEDYRGIPILGVSRYIEEMDWVVLAEKDVSEAFAPIVYLRNFTIVMGIVGILSLVIVAIFLARGITKSIDKLIKATKSIASGDLEHTVRIDKGNNEINELGKSFNSMIRNISKSTMENKKLFLQVKKGRDEWQKTFDAITDIITLHDKDYRIIRANKAFLEKFNIDFNLEKITSKKCYNVFHGAERRWKNCPLARSVTSMQPEHEEVNDPNMGGTFLISVYPLSNEKGGHYGFVHVAKDMTYRKKIEKQLVEKANELEKLNTELEDFVYIVSHDLKEPLFSMGGYISRLSKLYNDTFDDKGKKYLHRASVNVDKMSEKIHEIMKIIKAGRVTYDFRNTDSRVVVEDVVNGLEGKIKDNKIKLLIQDNLPAVLCDARGLRDVFFNLINNAIKFMGEDNKKQIKIGCHKNEHYYKFFVEDNGIGIQAEYQEQVFKMFKRLKDIEAEGTGAGLALAKKIVEKHTGEIWVESPVNNGRGSSFWFTIPIIRESSYNVTNV